jgi:hypothetical protein
MKEAGGGSGKWRERDVPHKGWTFVDFLDLGEPSQTCEMCEAVTIRYVHYMSHPDYPEQLGVGCVCAENMSEDRVGPKEREKRVANAAKRRSNWLTRTWRESRAGNSYLNVRGYNVVVYRTQGGWSFRISKDNPLAGFIEGEENEEWLSRRHYATEDAAKLGAFDKLTLIEPVRKRRSRTA